MLDMQIRTAGADDASTLGEWVRRSIRASNAADYEPTIIELMCANFEPSKVLERMAVRDVFAALHDGKLIGTVSFSRPRAKLYSLFIEPGFQHVGIGRRLVHHIERHATSRGCTELQLSASITARPFYERLGYATIRFEKRVGDGSTWLMRKALNGS